MAVSEYGTPEIDFCDSEGKNRLVIATSDDGTPALKFYGPDGKAIRVLP